MGNTGRVYAMDVDAKKLSELDRRAKRAGATCLKSKRIVATTPADFANIADRLVYATCSILPSENRAAVASLLENGGFTLVEERTVSPAATGVDGFYAATLRKHDC